MLNTFKHRRSMDVLAESRKNADAGATSDDQSDFTVPIKPDHPDDKRPPYSKAEALKIRTGKRPVQDDKAGMFGGFVRKILSPDDETAAEEDSYCGGKEGSDEVPQSPGLARPAWTYGGGARPRSRDSAAVTSASEGDDDDAPLAIVDGTTGKHVYPAPPSTPTDSIDKSQRKRGPTFSSLISRVSILRRSSSKTVSSLTPTLEEDGVDPKAKDAASTATTEDRAQQQQQLSRFRFVNANTNSIGTHHHLDTRHRREQLDSAQEWLDRLHKKTPCVFNNFREVAIYQSVPGPSDRLVKLIDNTPMTDAAPDEFRERVLLALVRVYDLWVAGALRDVAKYHNWTLDLDLGFMDQAASGSNHGSGGGGFRERVDSSAEDSARLRKRLAGVKSRVGSVFSRRKTARAVSAS